MVNQIQKLDRVLGDDCMRRWKFKGVIRQIIFATLHTEISTDRLNIISNAITQQVTEKINEQMTEYAIDMMKDIAEEYMEKKNT